MCLIALAHRVSDRYPLLIAANRDEDHLRPTVAAHPWLDTPEVVGGVDGLLGGAWLAVRNDGRFAAVTNLRGATPRPRSRGLLVREFVTSDSHPREYAEHVREQADEYAGFHLIAGIAGGEAVHVTREISRALRPGVYAISNAPHGEIWPKAGVAIDRIHRSLELDHREAIVEQLLHFLGESRGSDSLESEVFVRGERYGTRSSTVIIAEAGGIHFVEQSYGPNGVALGEPTTLRLAR